jgi:Lar family restriction alleviation protein
MSELKPCPFCGGNATRADDTRSREPGVWIGCFSDDCDVAPSVTAWAPSVEDAVKAWNRRAGEPGA